MTATQGREKTPSRVSTMSNLKKINTFILACAILATWALMFKVGDGSNVFLILLGVAFAIWAVGPYVLLLFLGRSGQTTRGQSIVYILGSLAVATLGLAIYYDGFFVNSDAQSGLLFIFVPIVQWMSCAMIFLLALFVERISRTA